jgi:DNA-binding GntR family transcriptional regulator
VELSVSQPVYHIQAIEDNKKTIAAMVQERIRDAILNGMLPAGSRLDQNQLADDLQVSLVPVREALKKLEGEGFVHIIPRRGAFVSESSIADMEDLYFTRILLEGQAAYHAADKLTDDDLQKLDQLMVEMGKALQDRNYNYFSQTNHDFHFTIYNAAKSKYLVNMIANLWELAQRYRFRYVFMADQSPVIQAEHQAILDACHARDAKALRDAIVQHMNQTLAGVKKIIEAGNNQ